MHKIGSIDERTVQIRKEVFEVSTKLKSDEKPFKRKWGLFRS